MLGLECAGKISIFILAILIKENFSKSSRMLYIYNFFICPDQAKKRSPEGLLLNSNKKTLFNLR